MTQRPLPHFHYHRDPVASGSIVNSDASCECCGISTGKIYRGNIYTTAKVTTLCPWCIADGSASKRFSAEFIDGVFCDEQYAVIELPAEFHQAVFGRTIGFATFNPVSWWVHCGEPAEFIGRVGNYEMGFECRKCKMRQTLNDYD